MPDDYDNEGSEPTKQSSLIFSPPFDRVREDKTEDRFTWLIQSLEAYWAQWHRPIIPSYDPETFGMIMGIIQPVKRLLRKHNEIDALAKVMQWETAIEGQPQLDTRDTISNLKVLQDIFTQLMAKHGHKDKSSIRYEWDEELKKKLELHALVEPHLTYFNNMNYLWDTEGKHILKDNGLDWAANPLALSDQICFFMTYHTVLNTGDIHCLVTGINNKGKSNTAIAMGQRCNWYYRNYWKDLASYIPSSKKYVPVPEFSMENDVVYLPLESSLDNLLGDTQFEIKDLNEGMKFANNLESMNRRVIKTGVMTYISRSHFPIIFYEYQMSKRPPAMLMERFNMWIHKMSKGWAVLSMASGLYRKTDPYYMKEIDKLKKDEQINDWFKNKNPNFITVFRAPRLSTKDEKTFKKLQREAHLSQMKADEIKSNMKNDWYLKLEEYWQKINIENILTEGEIADTLKEELGYNDRECKRFLKDYVIYSATKKGARKQMVIKSEE